MIDSKSWILWSAILAVAILYKLYGINLGGNPYVSQRMIWDIPLDTETLRRVIEK